MANDKSQSAHDVRDEDIKHDFDRDGFIILREYLTPAELSEMRERTDRYMDGKGDTAILKNLNKQDAWFQEQLVNGKHVALIETLIEDGLVPATAAWFNKPPGSSSMLKPHFDAIGNPRRPRNGCTIWIALDEADQQNGCLYYAKGSHQTKHDDSALYLDYDTHTDQAVAGVVAAGDAIIHSALTVHWSGENRSSRSRRAISYFYWGASSKLNSLA
ncbi:MAG: phytanoyl-CoA dioxygenase family protein [Pseudomonadales bacterium]|jgi:phytanoyl-CoA hydroxylase|nr:phytanoyl-CoA dioxygenase family protein [Pseudomonadales bacterium]MDP7147008.1 phytanoyl-CoA dioxygenase family protein [Pseudomonadales bacterium]MDP7359166.1 phytanoyl-CoA dioxygenase family protein [Pseudomonadales bacterium]MDP7596113.1 phytanoyl-CoA dioxygenase family protein [Pseudomonadales bacterium]HJN50663.1 phytanoyl-CoA dioxygenase family protein [Pseudomonadales bacterium]|tara:strand:+ start:2581 stop:3228 length:648 start_codon:yes stop_codon:yes gene_type:complete